MEQYKVLPSSSSETSMFGQNTPSRISESVMSHIMTRLNDIYTDSMEATVRETFSNAYDAVKANGSGEIRITLPSIQFPFYVIHDTGTGMSLDLVNNVLINYGETTKRENMDQIGSHGLGSKAPLAYSKEYSIETVQNGKMISFTTFSNNGVIETTPRVIEETDKPNGTKVTIPVFEKDFYTFKIKVETNSENSFDVPVYINNEKVIPGYSEVATIQISDNLSTKVYLANDMSVNRNIEIFNNFYTSSFSYVLGGSRYNNDGSELAVYMRKTILVQLIPGLVSFNSSRDRITVDDRLERLNEIIIEQLNNSDEIRKIALKKANASEYFPNFVKIANSVSKKNNSGIESKDFIHDETGVSFDHFLEKIQNLESALIEIGHGKTSYYDVESKGKVDTPVKYLISNVLENFSKNTNLLNLNNSIGSEILLSSSGEVILKRIIRSRSTVFGENPGNIFFFNGSESQIKDFGDFLDTVNVNFITSEQALEKIKQASLAKNNAEARKVSSVPKRTFIVKKANEDKELSIENFKYEEDQEGFINANEIDKFVILYSGNYLYLDDIVRDMIRKGEVAENDTVYVINSPLVNVVKAIPRDKIRMSISYEARSAYTRELRDSGVVRNMSVFELKANDMTDREILVASLKIEEFDFSKVSSFYAISDKHQSFIDEAIGLAPKSDAILSKPYEFRSKSFDIREKIKNLVQHIKMNYPNEESMFISVLLNKKQSYEDNDLISSNIDKITNELESIISKNINKMFDEIIEDCNI